MALARLRQPLVVVLHVDDDLVILFRRDGRPVKGAMLGLDPCGMEPPRFLYIDAVVAVVLFEAVVPFQTELVRGQLELILVRPLRARPPDVSLRCRVGVAAVWPALLRLSMDGTDERGLAFEIDPVSASVKIEMQRGLEVRLRLAPVFPQPIPITAWAGALCLSVACDAGLALTFKLGGVLTDVGRAQDEPALLGVRQDAGLALVTVLRRNAERIIEFVAIGEGPFLHRLEPVRVGCRRALRANLRRGPDMH